MGRIKARKKTKNRHTEFEDAPGTLERKCQQLATALRKSSCTAVFTGAGISTAASIPDYRGPNGVWTVAKKGLSSSVRYCDPVEASPTLSHMALQELYRRGLVQHVLSQNCDGLHLRSGLPQKALSEIHGNMHIEVCKNCEPTRQYIRPFDVTGKTGFRRHKTGRQCTVCFSELEDTIVHFGEYGRVRWPLNWEGVTEVLNQQNCQLILCLGSSLQIVQKYKHLWCEDRAKHLRPKLFIVNLQWTPKDRIAKSKIHGKCDVVMKRVIEILNLTIPPYCRKCDAVLNTRHRNTRNKELMNSMAACGCKSRSDCIQEASEIPVERPNKLPGWWKVGLQLLSSSKKSVSKLIASDESPAESKLTEAESFIPAKVGRGRPKKRPNFSSDGDLLAKATLPNRKRGRPFPTLENNTATKLPRTSVANNLDHSRSTESLVGSVVEALHSEFQKGLSRDVEKEKEPSEFDAFETIPLDVFATVEYLTRQVEQNLN